MATPNTAAIIADITATRARLQQSVEGLVSQVHPEAIKGTIGDAATEAVEARVACAKALVVDEAGIRWDKIGTYAIVGAGVVISLLLLKGVGRLFRA
ncbi:MAG: hypothetical protein LBM94_00830 [Propionibacteriaceae bacterium]|jgi:hypothetical protein|nr:hypothetical protein [Propionibacteriaceae bacterium]